VKILRIIYDWPPPWSGLAPHPYEVTVSQAKIGHKIHILCGRWPNSGPIEEPKGAKVYPIWREPVKGTVVLTSSVLLFFKYLVWRRRNRDVDIIHSHGHFGIWIYVYRAFLQKFFPWARELKTPLVVHFHNTVRGRWEKLKEQKAFILPHSRYVSWPLEEYADKTATKVAAACIFVSKDVAKEAQKYYKADTKRCFIVETGVNPVMFRATGQEERDKTRGDLGFDGYDKVILGHGNMVERKNIHILVEALSFLPPEYKILLVGPWPDKAYTERVNEVIVAKHLKDRIVKVGYTPYPQVPIAFHNADILVAPSSFEGLPKVVMQGLAAGIPCLVSGFELEDSVKGIFYLDDLSPKYIAKNIQSILAKKPEVEAQKVSQNYSWDRKVKEIEGVYEFAKKNYLL
jgi:glycosyltransferase involved in cell wall biosynthesis